MGVRLRVLVGAAKKFGITIEEPKSGSHWKATKGKELYPIPAHNRQRPRTYRSSISLFSP